MFQSPLVNTCGSIHQTLVIVMLRNPYDWALSMHENCWCGHPHSREWIAEQEFSDFIASPFPPDKYSFIQWLNYTPAFKNVMHLRACKTLSYLNISNWAPQVEFVRHEDVIVPSLSLPWLQSIADKYMLKLSPSLQKGSEGKSLLKPVIQYKAEGTKFDPEAAKKKSVWFNPDLMNQDPKRKSDMDLVVKNLVEKVEQLSGYRDAQGKDIKGLSEGSLVSKELKEGLAHRLFEEICAR